MSLSIRVRTFHVPTVSFLFFIWIRPHAWMICQPWLAGQIHVGQAIFRSPFLGPSLTRVGSAILNRAAQSPRMLPDSPTAKPHACTPLTLITNLTPKSQPMDPNHQLILCYVNVILSFERQPMILHRS